MTTEARMPDPTPIRGRWTGRRQHLFDRLAATMLMPRRYLTPWHRRRAERHLADAWLAMDELRRQKVLADAEIDRLAEENRALRTVVPVPDEQAIERAADVLERWYGDSPDRLHIARAVLTAALEQPE